MSHKVDNEHDIIDIDLYENIDDEEMYELLQQARQKQLETSSNDEENKKTKRPFPKWTFYLIAFAMLFQIIALFPQTFSIPAIDFLITSTKLSTNDSIQTYKQAVVVIETEENKGTGFSISEDGIIITNHHVIKGKNQITIAYPEHGLFNADVEATYPEIDLAILKVNEGENLPFLSLASKTKFEENEEVHFIGNPLRFQGIVNKGNIIGYTQLSNWHEKVIMIKAPIYRGNSGSPIINEHGLVIGVVFATLEHDIHGKVGLFIPIDYYYNYHTQSVSN